MKTGDLGGRLFIISAPSGCGKTTLCKKLLKDKLGLVHSVSVTTRPPRANERNNKDYIFVSELAFRGMVRKRQFLEYERNFGHLYGTPRKKIGEYLKKGGSVILSIDVKGAMKVKKILPDRSVLIFILPPSIADLKKRLTSRMSDGMEAIAARLKIAKKEMAYKDKYDYLIVNDRLDAAYSKLKDVITAELNRGGM